MRRTELHEGDSRAAQKTVLALGDDAALQGVIKSALGRGYGLFTAREGASALEMARTFGADVVLLDLGLENVDPNWFLGELARDPVLRNTPTILIRGSEDATDVLVERYFVYTVLQRPPAVTDLRWAVSQAIDR